MGGEREQEFLIEKDFLSLCVGQRVIEGYNWKRQIITMDQTGSKSLHNRRQNSDYYQVWTG